MFDKQSPPIGSSPDTLVPADDATAPALRVIVYDAESLEEREIGTVAELEPLLASDRRLWLDVQGLGDAGLLGDLAKLLGMHPLLIEDVVHVPQRPKVDAYPEHTLVVTRMLQLEEGGTLDMEQLSVVVHARYVVTFQERRGDVLEPVRNRLRGSGKGRIRTAGSGYLAYALLDTVIDGYFPVVEELGDILEDFEDRVMEHPGPGLLRELHGMKSTLLKLRRSVWPHRDSLAALMRGDSPLFDPDVRVFLRDTLDHAIHVGDIVESYRELVSGLMNTYLAVVSNRTNDVMKVLTIMASIFIPLTFMAGVYGMNFERMPELKWPWAYPALLGAMVLVAAGMVFYFRRLGWIGRDRRDEDAESS